jgi:hypothetical protein
MVRYLADTSAILKLTDPEVAAVLGPLVEAGQVATCVRSIPLPGFLLEELKALRGNTNPEPAPADLLFTSRSGQPLLRSTFRRQVWRPALVRAGLLGRVTEQEPDKWQAAWPDQTGMEWTKEFTT